MSAVVVGLLFTAGASTWIYTKLQRYSGNNTKQSAIAVGVCAVAIFFIFYSIFKLVVK